MSNVFLEYIKKNKFAFGIIISVITSALIVKTALEYAKLIIDDWLILIITFILFAFLFIWYIHIIAKCINNGTFVHFASIANHTN